MLAINRSVGVIPEMKSQGMCVMYTSTKCCPLWLWNLENTLSEVQNRGISGPTNFFLRKVKHSHLELLVSHSTSPVGLHSQNGSVQPSPHVSPTLNQMSPRRQPYTSFCRLPLFSSAEAKRESFLNIANGYFLIFHLFFRLAEPSPKIWSLRTGTKMNILTQRSE